MNDNGKDLSLQGEITEIIESFAPGYVVSLKGYESTKVTLLKLKVSILLSMAVSVFYIDIFMAIFNAATVMAFLVLSISAYCLWRVSRLERDIGRWTLHYNPLWRSRIKYPFEWEFHPAETRLPAHRSAR